jgi:putative spermidine/putrescine transport system ATP-binding protein
MSDRLAVFNAGQIEQVGQPAEVYEHPASEFIAGFVGVSNVLERGGQRFTIRPEKVRLLVDSEPEPDGLHVEPGVISDVAYIGMVTRYAVQLKAGGELYVVRQNLDTTSADALAERGRPVRVAWREGQTYAIREEGQ